MERFPPSTTIKQEPWASLSETAFDTFIVYLGGGGLLSKARRAIELFAQLPLVLTPVDLPRPRRAYPGWRAQRVRPVPNDLVETNRAFRAGRMR
jgi:hypothetical protein